MNSGTVIWYDQTHGYGFVKDDVEDDVVFVWRDVLADYGLKFLRSGDWIEYDLYRGNSSSRVALVHNVCNPEEMRTSPAAASQRGIVGGAMN